MHTDRHNTHTHTHTHTHMHRHNIHRHRQTYIHLRIAKESEPFKVTTFLLFSLFLKEQIKDIIFSLPPPNYTPSTPPQFQTCQRHQRTGMTNLLGHTSLLLKAACSVVDFMTFTLFRGVSPRNVRRLAKSGLLGSCRGYAEAVAALTAVASE
jgi:hypothetical protein